MCVREKGADEKKYGQTDRQTDRTDRQTDTHTHTHTHALEYPVNPL